MLICKTNQLMPYYEKIVAILSAWKVNTQLPNEQRMFFIEPHSTHAFSDNISAIIRVNNVNDNSKYCKERSEVLTLAGLPKEIDDLDDEMNTLQLFLETFTENFYKRAEKNSNEI